MTIHRASANRLAGLLFSILLAACGGSDDSAPEPVAFTEVTLTLFRPFAAGEYVFRSAQELQVALGEAPFQVFPVGIVLEEPAIPDWDFQARMIVGLSQGTGAWCMAPRIVDVNRVGSDLLVQYRVPTMGTLACMRLAPLIAFVQVPRVTGRIEFRKVEVPAVQELPAQP